jgi:hypothetical protein
MTTLEQRATGARLELSQLLRHPALGNAKPARGRPEAPGFRDGDEHAKLRQGQLHNDHPGDM